MVQKRMKCPRCFGVGIYDSKEDRFFCLDCGYDSKKAEQGLCPEYVWGSGSEIEMLDNKDIKIEKDCTHLADGRESYSLEEHERVVKEAMSISTNAATDMLHELLLHCFQMDIDIAPMAGNAFLDDDAEQMEFFKGFHRALVMMREHIEEKRNPLLLKEYHEEESKKEVEYFKEQMASLKDYDHKLFRDVVAGLRCEFPAGAGGWKLGGGLENYVVLSKGDSAIKIFRDPESQVIKICFTAEPKEDEKEEDTL